MTYPVYDHDDTFVGGTTLHRTTGLLSKANKGIPKCWGSITNLILSYHSQDEMQLVEEKGGVVVFKRVESEAGVYTPEYQVTI